MRFFTPEWWHGRLTDEECEARQEGFAQHLSQIRDKLPQAIKDLFENYSLHDGRIIQFQTNPVRGDLTFEIDGWNDFNGSYPVIYRLEFTDVKRAQFSGGDRPVDDPTTLPDLGYYEIEIEPDGRFRMSLLFADDHELEIVFHSLNLKTTKST